MTQVNNINESLVVQAGHQSSAANKTGFQDSLETAMSEKTTETPGNGQTAALSEPQAAHFIPVSEASTDDIASQTDGLLVLLESYADGLENQDATLKDLAPLVDEIRNGAQRLMESAEKNTSMENDLRNIATQTILTANTEYIKFQRGDYL